MMQGAAPPPVIDYYTPKHHASGRLPGLLVAILIGGGVVIPPLTIGLVSFLLLVTGVNWPVSSRCDAMMVLAHPLFAWPFYGMALVSAVAVIRLIRNPPLAVMNRWVRVPLWVGLAINVHYLLAVAIGGDESGWGIVFGLGDATGAAIVLGLVIATARKVRSGGLPEVLLPMIARRMGSGLLAWLVCLAAGVTWAVVDDGHANGLVAIPLFFLGLPHVQIVAFTSALLIVRTLDPSPAHRRDAPAWLMTYASGWTACGAMLVWSWYFHPMHTRPICYIATAASRGHRRWVGGRLLRLCDGREIIVNRQLHRLITLELLLAWWSPAVHRPLREFYDRVGPPLAAGLTNPWLADVAYVALKPLEWMAAGIGWVSLRSARQ